MNSNQKSQIEKVLKLLDINEALERKKSVLEVTIENNVKKIDKIQAFLEKQNVTVEEQEAYLEELLELRESSETSSKEETEIESSTVQSFSE